MSLEKYKFVEFPIECSWGMFGIFRDAERRNGSWNGKTCWLKTELALADCIENWDLFLSRTSINHFGAGSFGSVTMVVTKLACSTHTCHPTYEANDNTIRTHEFTFFYCRRHHRRYRPEIKFEHNGRHWNQKTTNLFLWYVLSVLRLSYLFKT